MTVIADDPASDESVYQAQEVLNAGGNLLKFDREKHRHKEREKRRKVTKPL